MVIDQLESSIEEIKQLIEKFPSRELSLARTKAEEAEMWARKAEELERLKVAEAKQREAAR